VQAKESFLGSFQYKRSDFEGLKIELTAVRMRSLRLVRRFLQRSQISSEWRHGQSIEEKNLDTITVL
jgi:hypothetical protein